MARKRPLLFRRLQPLLKRVFSFSLHSPVSPCPWTDAVSRGFSNSGGFWDRGKIKAVYISLALATAILCIFITPVLAKTPNFNAHLADAQQMLEQGNYEAAARQWQQEAATAQKQGNILKASSALNNLSQAYQKLGRWQDAKAAITDSLKLLGKPNTREGLLIQAQALDVQGELQLGQGQTEAALVTWRQAGQIYKQLKDTKSLVRNRINQAQAFKNSGAFPRAIDILEGLKAELAASPPSVDKAVVLRSLGNTYLAVGRLSAARESLNQSLQIAQAINSPENISTAYFSLGNIALSEINTTIAQQDLGNIYTITELLDSQFGKINPLLQLSENIEVARKLYQDAINTATEPTTKVQAQLNQLTLLVNNYLLFTNLLQSLPQALPGTTEGQLLQESTQIKDLENLNIKLNSEIKLLLTQISPELASIPSSRVGINFRINYVKNLVKLNDKTQLRASVDILKTAVQQARELSDQRAESEALGTLGRLYEQNKQWAEAQELTKRALVQAQVINSSELVYQWQWQLARVLQAQGKQDEARIFYSSTVNTLKSLRSDLVAINQDSEFNFRDSVEPVYRQTAELLLAAENNPKNLEQARELIESLQLAELDNFFREACIQGQRVNLDELVQRPENQKTAIIYPLILSNKLHVIAKIPNQKGLQHKTIPISDKEVKIKLMIWREALVNPIRRRKSQQIAQEVYEWLIAPFEQDLQNHVDTLVFVLDGYFRNVPMAALYDGKQYLIEKYAIALSSGLQLLAPKPLTTERLNVIAAGLVKAPPQALERLPAKYRKFPALGAVEKELEFIQTKLRSKIIPEQKFTSTQLQQQINAAPFGVVHLATHGVFSSNQEETFILAYDGPIFINELTKILQSRDTLGKQAIELLVLSACQTATGDNRAALGLAGVAIRTGVRSTLASLWTIDDNITAEFISTFYQALNSKMTKAKALQTAQLKLLRDGQSSDVWSPYVLVGNWL